MKRAVKVEANEAIVRRDGIPKLGRPRFHLAKYSHNAYFDVVGLVIYLPKMERDIEPYAKEKLTRVKITI